MFRRFHPEAESASKLKGTEMFELDDAEGGGWYWRVVAGENGETLCHSEVYTTKRAALEGIASCKRIVPGADTRDVSKND